MIASRAVCHCHNWGGDSQACVRTVCAVQLTVLSHNPLQRLSSKLFNTLGVRLVKRNNIDARVINRLPYDLCDLGLYAKEWELCTERDRFRYFSTPDVGISMH